VDVIFGGEGDDTIDCGTESDTVDGGPGFDKCVDCQTFMNCEIVGGLKNS
jgi:hypothetical protein